MVLIVACLTAAAAASSGKIQARARVMPAEPASYALPELTEWVDAGLVRVETHTEGDGDILQIEWIAN